MIIISYCWEVQPHECLIILTALALPIELNNLDHVPIYSHSKFWPVLFVCAIKDSTYAFIELKLFFWRLHLSFYIDCCRNIVYHSSSMFIHIRQQLVQKHFGVNWCNSKCALKIVCCLVKVETISYSFCLANLNRTKKE